MAQVVPLTAPLPVVTGIAPDFGPLAGGALTITGTGFTGATAVTFAGVPVTAFTVVKRIASVGHPARMAENTCSGRSGVTIPRMYWSPVRGT